MMLSPTKIESVKDIGISIGISGPDRWGSLVVEDDERWGITSEGIQTPPPPPGEDSSQDECTIPPPPLDTNPSLTSYIPPPPPLDTIRVDIPPPPGFSPPRRPSPSRRASPSRRPSWSHSQMVEPLVSTTSRRHHPPSRKVPTMSQERQVYSLGTQENELKPSSFVYDVDINTMVDHLCGEGFDKAGKGGPSENKENGGTRTILERNISTNPSISPCKAPCKGIQQSIPGPPEIPVPIAKSNTSSISPIKLPAMNPNVNNKNTDNSNTTNTPVKGESSYPSDGFMTYNLHTPNTNTTLNIGIQTPHNSVADGVRDSGCTVSYSAGSAAQRYNSRERYSTSTEFTNTEKCTCLKSAEKYTYSGSSKKYTYPGSGEKYIYPRSGERSMHTPGHGISSTSTKPPYNSVIKRFLQPRYNNPIGPIVPSSTGRWIRVIDDLGGTERMDGYGRLGATWIINEEVNHPIIVRKDIHIESEIITKIHPLPSNFVVGASPNQKKHCRDEEKARFTQKGPAEIFVSGKAFGLIRMPIEPQGWVTVDATRAGGPCYLIELSGIEMPENQTKSIGLENTKSLEMKKFIGLEEQSKLSETISETTTTFDQINQTGNSVLLSEPGCDSSEVVATAESWLSTSKGLTTKSWSTFSRELIKSSSKEGSWGRPKEGMCKATKDNQPTKTTVATTNWNGAVSCNLSGGIEPASTVDSKTPSLIASKESSFWVPSSKESARTLLASSEREPHQPSSISKESWCSAASQESQHCLKKHAKDTADLDVLSSSSCSSTTSVVCSSPTRAVSCSSSSRSSSSATSSSVSSFSAYPTNRLTTSGLAPNGLKDNSFKDAYDGISPPPGCSPPAWSTRIGKEEKEEKLTQNTPKRMTQEPIHKHRTETSTAWRPETDETSTAWKTEQDEPTMARNSEKDETATASREPEKDEPTLAWRTQPDGTTTVWRTKEDKTVLNSSVSKTYWRVIFDSKSGKGDVLVREGRDLKSAEVGILFRGDVVEQLDPRVVSVDGLPRIFIQTTHTPNSDSKSSLIGYVTLDAKSRGGPLFFEKVIDYHAGGDYRPSTSSDYNNASSDYDHASDNAVRYCDANESNDYPIEDYHRGDYQSGWQSNAKSYQSDESGVYQSSDAYQGNQMHQAHQGNQTGDGNQLDHQTGYTTPQNRTVEQPHGNSHSQSNVQQSDQPNVQQSDKPPKSTNVVSASSLLAGTTNVPKPSEQNYSKMSLGPPPGLRPSIHQIVTYSRQQAITRQRQERNDIQQQAMNPQQGSSQQGMNGNHNIDQQGMNGQKKNHGMEWGHANCGIQNTPNSHVPRNNFFNQAGRNPQSNQQVTYTHQGSTTIETSIGSVIGNQNGGIAGNTSSAGNVSSSYSNGAGPIAYPNGGSNGVYPKVASKNGSGYFNNLSHANPPNTTGPTSLFAQPGTATIVTTSKNKKKKNKNSSVNLGIRVPRTINVDQTEFARDYAGAIGGGKISGWESMS